MVVLGGYQPGSGEAQAARVLRFGNGRKGSGARSWLGVSQILLEIFQTASTPGSGPPINRRTDGLPVIYCLSYAEGALRRCRCRW
jgi:hypothetical protein